MREPVDQLFPRSGRALYRVATVATGAALRTIYRIRVDGLEHVLPEGAAIIAANHCSFLDPTTITVSLPRRITYLAKAELFEGRFSGWLFSAGGQIPVNRTDPQHGEPMLAGLRILEAGGLLGVHPEGSRSPDGRLYRGKTGVARLAHASGAPVIPVGVAGTHAIFPKGAKRPKLHGTIDVRFGAPIQFPATMGPDDTTMRSFVDDLMQRIAVLSDQSYVDAYALPIQPHADVERDGPG